MKIGVIIRKLICYLSLLIFNSYFLYSQPQEQCIINDKNVRLRENPGLNAKILRYLMFNEKVDYISSKDLHDGSEYKWVNIKTESENGWVYGEYISRTSSQSKGKNFQYIEDAGIKIMNEVVYSGMHENDLIRIMGLPSERLYDDTYKEDTLTYGVNNELIFIIHKDNNKIHHIIINSNYTLCNNVEIGMNISEIDKNNIQIFNRIEIDLYMFTLKNMFRSDFYDTSVIITTDKNGVITEIQIGLPQP